MEAVWVVASSNDWPLLMWRAVDATERDTGPFENHNLAMALFFFGVASFSLLILLNLFTSVFVCVYLAQSAKASSSPAGLVSSAPRGKPSRRELPFIQDFVFENPLRQHSWRMLKSRPVQALVNFAIFGTLATMLAESYHMSATQKQVVTGLDVFFTFVFGSEVMLRLASLGIGAVVLDRWMVFDYVIYGFAVADLILDSAVVGKWMRSARWIRSLKTIRLLRVLRSYRLLRSVKGVQNLLQTLRAALPMMTNLLVVLCIVFFCFGCLGVKMYGPMCVDGDQLLPGIRANRCLLMQEQDEERRLASKLLPPHTHFRHLGWALLTLLKIGTVDGISNSLQILDSTPLPRVPDPDSALQSAIRALRQLPDAGTFAGRRALILTARNHLGGCVTAEELNKLQDAGVVDCRPWGDETDNYPSCYTTCGSTWLSQLYFISFASITSFVLLNIMVSVLIVALGSAVQGRKPKKITHSLPEDKLRLIYKRWKWNGILRTAYGHWLVLNEYEDHSDALTLTSRAPSSQGSFDLTSLSSCGIAMGSRPGSSSSCTSFSGSDDADARMIPPGSRRGPLQEEQEEVAGLPGYDFPKAVMGMRPPTRYHVPPRAAGTAAAAAQAQLQVWFCCHKAA